MKRTIFLLSASIATFMSNAQVIVTTLAGSTSGFADGPGNVAQFNAPWGVATDAAGNVYVGDSSNHKIRKITPAGVVSTFAGSTQGYTDDTGDAAQFNTPTGVATDATGNVYLGDLFNYNIRKIIQAAEVSTLAGSTIGYADGPGDMAQFSAPWGVAIDAVGNVYVADISNDNIRKITPAGVVSTLAGFGQGFADGIGAAAKFCQPRGVATDSAGNVYIADTCNSKIRKITPAGEVSTLAGSTAGFADGTGATAQFNQPFGLTTDSAGNVYVADTLNNKIRKITPEGLVSTLAGSTAGFADGTGATAKFDLPASVATDAAGNVYIADKNNHKIRKITQQLGVDQNEINSKITMYPNPVTNVLTLQLENGCVLDKISITDLSGKIIITLTQNITAVNVENLSQGIYILEVYSGEEKYVGRFVKE
ncbi:T9SS type A sorting domain-containing protein [Flavobacterium sp. RSB2_4_14]|uniref:T9SS type A sorting domain-containing protein n=1 Tax=Flavobacterium sp. RSB2_4_14 TaxID=3447665 RepID=UPI003F2EE511